MIEIDAVRRDRQQRERAITPQSAASGHGPRSLASLPGGIAPAQVEHTLFQAFARRSHRHALACRKVEAHQAEGLNRRAA
jgi:hypothetical protein